MPLISATVELFIDAAWVDITPHVYVRDPIRITHGHSAEFSRAETSRCGLTLNNRDGRYSPRNPTGVYYRKIGRNTQLRVSIDGVVRFVGEVAEWPLQWNKSETDVWTPIEASGSMRRLGQGRKALRSALYRKVTNQSSVKAYWPMEDAAGSATLASPISGVPPMRITGPVTLAAVEGPAGSEPLPTFAATAGANGPIPRISPTSWRVDWLSRLDAAPGAAVSMVSIATSSADAYNFRARLDATNLIVDAFDAFGASILSQTAALPSDFYTNPDWVRGALTIAQNGANIDVGMSLLRADATVVALISTSITTANNGRPRAVGFAGEAADRQLGHVTITEGTSDPFGGGGLGAVAGHATETAADRIQRLCDEEGIPLELLGTAADTAAMGPQRPGILLDLLQECADADLGILCEPQDMLGICYRTRTSMYNQAPLLTLDYPTQVVADLTPIDDDQQTRNDITARRPGGSEARAVLETGPMSIQAPPDGVGIYDTTVDANLAGDGFLPAHAGWLLNLGTVDEARYPVIHVNTLSPGVAQFPHILTALNALEVGDRIDIVNLPAWLPPDDVSQLVQGITEVLDDGGYSRHVTINCFPASPYAIAEYEATAGATVNKYGSAGSELNEALDTTETGVDVLTTIAPVWTAVDAEDGFDIEIGGERMTVTDVGAAVANVQTFTVVRSVNGVVKTHAIGTAVRLWTPARYGL